MDNSQAAAPTRVRTSKRFGPLVWALRNRESTMRTIFVFLVGAALTAPALVRAEQPPAAQAETALATVSIPIKGMACSACAARVTKTLSAIDGVNSVDVSAPKGSARVKYAAAKVSPEQLRAAVNKIGFEAGPPVEDK